MLDTAARDVSRHVTGRSRRLGRAAETSLRYVFNNSQVANKPNSILVIGWETAPEPFEDLGVPYSAAAIRWGRRPAGFQVTFADTAPEIGGGVSACS